MVTPEPKKRPGSIFLSVLCVVLFISHWSLVTSHCFAAVPPLIRYQGQLTDSAGSPLSGSHTLTFSLYDAATGGTPLWTETQPNVPVTNGQFSVLLGSGTTLDTVDWSQPLYLGITVNTDPEMIPRQPITSVPLAIRAEQAEGLTAPIAPSLISPQGAGSGLDADAVDGQHATFLLDRANHTGTQPPTTVVPQGPGSGLDADSVDGKHATAFLNNGDPATGDLAGAYPNPTVAKLQNRTLASTAPTDTQVLKWNAGSSQWEPGTVAGGWTNMQVFTTNGTWAKPASTTKVLVKVWGGGGGGGGVAGSGPTGAGGGGAGGYSEAVVSVAGNVAVTVGTGGTGAPAGGTGAAGGNSSFAGSATITANGGGGGANASVGGSGGAGGTASSGTLNLSGQNGETRGAGGSAPFGGAGGFKGSSSSGATAGVTPGGGGGGGGPLGSSGQSGAPGLVIVYWAE